MQPYKSNKTDKARRDIWEQRAQVNGYLGNKDYNDNIFPLGSWKVI